MDFRERLLATLRAIRPILGVEGVIVAGSEVPNLLEKGAASTLVVSEDVDLAVSVDAMEEVAQRLTLLSDFIRSADEPSVLLPRQKELVEVNFIGFDAKLTDPTESYVAERPGLSLLVFGSLGYLLPPRTLQIDDVRLQVPSTAGLMLEKLVTERSGRKGDRDLLVVAGLLAVATEHDLDAFVARARSVPAELRAEVLSNLSILSLLPAMESMPDPRVHRATVSRLIERLEVP
jgi:hypothetical protein